MSIPDAGIGIGRISCHTIGLDRGSHVLALRAPRPAQRPEGPSHARRLASAGAKFDPEMSFSWALEAASGRRLYLPPCGADAFYKQGVGDCLLTYENEVIATNWMLGRSERTRSKILPYVVPQNNIRVENPVAIVDKVVDDRGPEVRHAAEAFVRWGAEDACQGCLSVGAPERTENAHGAHPWA